MPYSLAERILITRVGGRVERCHTIPHPPGYTVAAHSWGVAMLMYLLWPEDFPRLGAYCLVHDVPEGWLGDIPSPTLHALPGTRAELNALENLFHMKLQLPAPNDLSSADQQKIKWCDRVELYLWCKEQLACGNGAVRDMHDRLLAHFCKTNLPPRIGLLFNYLENDLCPLGPQGVLEEVLASKK